jgi:hypothetical protein
MKTRAGTSAALLLLVLGGFGALVSCGSRTGLFVLEEPLRADAAPRDTSLLPTVDGTIPVDTSPNDVSFDALPPIDVAPVPDVFVNDCPDAGATLIYVVTSQNQLYSFYPPTGAFTQIGLLACPAIPDPVTGVIPTPFSMAVDKKGTAFVVFGDGELFQVSTQTAACIPTGYTPNQDGISTFGMSFVGNPSGMGDTLYVAADVTPPGSDGILATIDTTSLLLAPIGAFNPQTVSGAELSGTGDGRLFAFYAINANTSSAVAQIDPATATVLANNDLTNLPQYNTGPGGGGGWAFGFWGGSFYLFTSPTGQGSLVTQFNPADLSQTNVANLADTIVGAGVSTCAPMQ